MKISTTQTKCSPVEKLKSLRPSIQPIIVLSEGNDCRIIGAAIKATKIDIAKIILLGDEVVIKTKLAKQNYHSSGISIHDPSKSSLSGEFCEIYYNLRKNKGLTIDQAFLAVQTPLIYASLMVQTGRASGTISGAVETTADVIRVAIQVIGKSPTSPIVSSCFIINMPSKLEEKIRSMIFSDCGLVINPNEKQLAAIAISASRSCKDFLDQEPIVAMLSFSTKGSAKDKSISKITKALRLVQHQHPKLLIDGEMQFDTAFAPDVAIRKAPKSKVAGIANVMVFPNLDSGNIGYKIAQQIRGAQAIGPILQGLNKPANDLSRNCSIEDILQMIAVTGLQVSRGK